MGGKDKGPTRKFLQPECAVPAVQNSVRLQTYFNLAKQIMVQGESYFQQKDLRLVRLIEISGGGVIE